MCCGVFFVARTRRALPCRGWLRGREHKFRRPGRQLVLQHRPQHQFYGDQKFDYLLLFRLDLFLQWRPLRLPVTDVYSVCVFGLLFLQFLSPGPYAPTPYRPDDRCTWMAQAPNPSTMSGLLGKRVQTSSLAT